MTHWKGNPTETGRLVASDFLSCFTCLLRTDLFQITLIEAGLTGRSSRSATEAEAIEAEGAPEGIKSDHLHQEIPPAVAAHPLGAT